MVRLGIGAIGLCAFIIAACSHSADDVARAFVDRLFVETNQRAALAMAEGPARTKIERELQLLGNQPSSQSGERPRVFYRELKRLTTDEDVTIYFRLTVVVIGDQPIEPEVIVRVRQRGDAWRVVDYDLVPPHTGTEPSSLRPETRGTYA